MKQHNYQRGKSGEEIAANYLQKQGYRIIEQNFSAKFGEIDLICKDNDTLVFVEVKLKVGDDFGSPEEMMTKQKISQVMRIGQLYLTKNPKMSQYNVRIDGVAIVIGEGEMIDRISHYENIGMELS